MVSLDSFKIGQIVKVTRYNDSPSEFEVLKQYLFTVVDIADGRVYPITIRGNYGMQGVKNFLMCPSELEVVDNKQVRKGGYCGDYCKTM